MEETVFVEAEILQRTYKEVQQYFARVDDLAHGWEHVERVYKLALSLAEQEGANSFVVGMAALMHDLGRAVQQNEEANSDHTHHADVSVTVAQQVLQRYHVAPETQEAIVHAIVAHSFSKGIEPRTLEARVVRDADRLDGLGAIGILRWALTGAARRTPDTLSYHPDDPFGMRHELDDSHYMLDHFYRKLLKLEHTMSTKTGRTLARHRTAFMRMYLDEFHKELEQQ